MSTCVEGYISFDAKQNTPNKRWGLISDKFKKIHQYFKRQAYSFQSDSSTNSPQNDDELYKFK